MSCLTYQARSILRPGLLAALLAAALTTAGHADVPWHLDGLDQTQLPLDGAYRPAGTGEGVHVYIVSTGIDPTHPELGGRADVFHDATGGDGLDAIGHGTWLAGIVGGSTIGVAPEAMIHGVRAFDASGSATSARIVAALDVVCARAQRPGVVVLPFAFADHPTIDQAVQDLIDCGLVVITAAGDVGEDACVYSPARVPDVITVGALDTSLSRWSWSNGGACVDLFAPGVMITSAWLDHGMATHDGTAGSTAIVGGLAAIHLGLGAADSQVSVWERLRSVDCFSLAIDCDLVPPGGVSKEPIKWYEVDDDACPADLDGDNDIGVSDLLSLIGAWGPCADGCPQDLDGNGVVDIDDLLTLFSTWGVCA